MRNWVAIVSGIYLAALLLLAGPLFLACFGTVTEAKEWLSFYRWALGVAAILAVAQSVLLFVPMDLARGRPIARRRLLVPVIATGILCSLLMLAGLGSLILGIRGDDFDKGWGPALLSILPLPFLWGVWAWVFYAYRRTEDPASLMSRLMKGLLRGSVLELLVAVPSHVVARQRNDCCAPAGTFFGIATGLALMLLSFGPGVLFLFAKRFGDLRRAKDG